MASLKVAQIAALCRAEFEGDGERLIHGANALEQAKLDELSFAGTGKVLELAKRSSAGCLLVSEDFPHRGPWAIIRVPQPRASFAQVLSVLYAVPKPEAILHPTAIIDPTAKLGADVTVGALAVIGANTTVGSSCNIGSGCVVGEHVSIGEGATLHANVTVYRNVQIGSRVIVHSGCVIGADGFGFARTAQGYQKFPQVGTVVIGDDVELGANTCVDRAALGRTVIGNGSKLDNLVHVAHNVQIGCNVVIAAQTGFSGGVIVGDDAVVGGQVGIGDKAIIDSGAVVGSGSGILTGARVRSGEAVWGTPARPLRQYLKGLAHVSRLGEFRSELKELKQQLHALRKPDGTNEKGPN